MDKSRELGEKARVMGRRKVEKEEVRMLDVGHGDRERKRGR